MRVWDLDAGYLSRQRLLGEHREIHGMYVVLSEDRKGYRQHPETVRWEKTLPAVALRHAQLAAEMAVRGYNHRSPIVLDDYAPVWPDTFIDTPAAQAALLAQKYGPDERGRLPLPKNNQQLWAQHKYSVMARSPARYKDLGPRVAKLRGAPSDALWQELIEVLREPPALPRTRNAVAHMWGYVSKHVDTAERALVEQRMERHLRWVLDRVVALSQQHGVTYLLESTALGELSVHLPEAVDGADD